MPRSSVSTALVRIVQRPDFRRWGQWAIVVAIAAYLAYETGRYRVLHAPIPVIAASIVAPALLGVTLGVGRRPPRPPGSWRRWSVAALGLIGLATAVYLVARLRFLSLGRRLEDAVIDDLSSLAAEIDRPRLFGVPAWLVVGLAVLALVLGLGIGFRRRTRPGAREALVLLAITMMVLGDLALFESVGLRDLRLDLRAGALFDQGQGVYLAAPLVIEPHDPTMLPFLYPPLTLPAFGALSQLPFEVVATAWVVGSLGTAVGSLRLFGVTWRWCLVLLLWPGFAEGLYVGNVAIPALVLFALGSRAGGALVMAGIFKLQNGIPSLWLVREGRWAAFLAGVGGVLALSLVTLPFTGLGRWSEWLQGLDFYRQSQVALPALYGLALPSFLPYPVYLALAATAVVVALRSRGPEGLRRLGVASVVASPSLYTHGFPFALPGLLELNAFWFWFAIALTSTVLGGGWWIAIAIAIAAWYFPALGRHRGEAEPLHPLGRAPEPSPTGSA